MVQKIGLGRAVGAAVDDAIHLSLRKEPPHRLTIVARRGSVLGDERLAELLAGERIGRVVQPAVDGDEAGLPGRCGKETAETFGRRLIVGYNLTVGWNLCGEIIPGEVS